MIRQPMDAMSPAESFSSDRYQPCTIPAGIWSIQWLSQPFPTRGEMLALWLRLEQWRTNLFPRIERVKVLIDPDCLRPGYKASADQVQLVLRDSAGTLPGQPSAIPDIRTPEPPIPAGRHVALVVPVAPGDGRWEGIGLTASDLFLGSSLSRSGYRVTLSHPRFPKGPPHDLVTRSNVMGISLCEDLLPSVRTWFTAAEAIIPDWIAMGGPMVTLSPLPAVAHLPRGNLWIRGDGEGVFPKVLQALGNHHFLDLHDDKGILVVRPGLLMAWNFNAVNRPPLPVESDFDFSFVSAENWAKGVEINISRGCRRTCTFCSRVQGRKQRRMPESAVNRLLKRMRSAMILMKNPQSGALNINDDDILQDPDYAARILPLIHNSGFRLWGIQTSISSVLGVNGPAEDVLDLLSRREYYVKEPLIWLGTDAFVQPRGKHLAKQVPARETLERLLAGLDSRGIRHWHYWICSDPYSGWKELVDELDLIRRWWNRFASFHILPHSPFLVPYPTTPLYAQLMNSARGQHIRYREWLQSPIPCLNYPLVERVETDFEMLNLMLRGHLDGHHPPFLESLRRRDSLASLETAHYFIRQERLRLESISPARSAWWQDLQGAQEKLEKAIMEVRSQSHAGEYSHSIQEAIPPWMQS